MNSLEFNKSDIALEQVELNGDYWKDDSLFDFFFLMILIHYNIQSEHTVVDTIANFFITESTSVSKKYFYIFRLTTTKEP